MKKGWFSERKFREATSSEELCLPTDAEARAGEACGQEGAVAPAGLQDAELHLPNVPRKSQEMPWGHVMGSVHKGSHQDKPTK